MQSPKPALLAQLARNPKRLFLIDGLGALLSASLLGLVVGHWEGSFGMPQTTCNVLALIALGFAAYSISCYFFVRGNWKIFLKVIAFANLAYCCLTLALASLQYATLQPLGIAYFLGECMVVGGLIYCELHLAFARSAK
jgi:hypothetical protein